jgi:small subunit ribosomal protein S6
VSSPTRASSLSEGLPFKALHLFEVSFGLCAGQRQQKEGMMPLYEHVFLARQDASTQQVDDLTNQFKAIVEGAGGKVAKTEYWGVKSLTYRMNKNRKAHFTLMNLEAPADAISEIERQERLSEDVLRYMTIRVDELEEGPSAMMRKAERDDREREGRGFGGGFGGGGFGGGGRFGDRDRDRGPRRDRDDRAPRDNAEPSSEGVE